MSKKLELVIGKAIKWDTELTPRQKFVTAWCLLRRLYADGSGRHIYELTDSLHVSPSDEHYFELAQRAYCKRITNRNCGSYFFHFSAIIRMRERDAGRFNKHHIAALTRRGEE